MADNYTTIEQTKKGLRAAQSSITSAKTALEGRMSAAEDAILNNPGYDDTALSGRVNAVEGLLDGHSVGKDVPADAVFTDTVYDDTSLAARVSANESAIAGIQPYDDTALSGRVSTVEGLIGGHSVGKDVPADAVFTDTVYDDTSIEGRVSANETAIAALQAGSYDDTAITNRVSAVENLLDGHSVEKDVPSDAVFTDTVYDDTSLAGRVSAAEAAIDTLETSGYDDTALAARVTANENAISTLNGSGAGSVSKSVADAIDAIVDGAPGTYDTFKEISDWIQEDQTGAAAMAADLANKVNKIEGKSLSTNDYTDEDKSKLAGLSNYDDTALAGRVSANESAIQTLQMSGYDDTAITGRVSAVENLLDGHSVGKDVPSDAVFTDTVYDDTSLAARVSANESAIAGIQPYDDTALSGRVSTVEGLIGGHSVGKDVPADAVFTDTVYDDSTITAALADKADSADLAAVATSGSYNDLTDIPTTSGGGAIPAYIVGTNEMGADWLSETEGGEALTPMDLQEYVILTSGSWLRKHVIWMEDLKVYRLAGKVGISDEKIREVFISTDTQTQTGTQYNNGVYTANNVTLGTKGTITFDFNCKVGGDNAEYTYIQVRAGEIVLEQFSGRGSQNTYAKYTKTFPVLPSYNGLKPNIKTVYRSGAGYNGFSVVERDTVVTTYTYDEVYDDYETDDVIDITEEEVKQIWEETAGAQRPTNNVISSEERVWGHHTFFGTIYCKWFQITSLPNNGTINFPHGINDISGFFNIDGVANGTNVALPIPNVGIEATDRIQLKIDNENISITTGIDRSNLSASITLYYYKTTD